MRGHWRQIKKRVASVLIMAMITTILISFTLIAVNVGFGKNFLVTWLGSWWISYLIAVFVMLFIAPKVQSILDSRLK